MFLTSDSRDFQVVDLGEATALVAELAGDVLPGRLLEHVARTVGDLLIDAAFLARVDFALAKLLLDGVETLVEVILLLGVASGTLLCVVHVEDGE